MQSPKLLHIILNITQTAQRAATAMIVCSCNCISDREIRAIASEGVECPVETYARLGCAPQCGQCLDHARDILDENKVKVAA